jgi:archaellum biogenesis ATPase FlaH
MEKLWAELQERTYLLKWPDGMKDANQTFLEHCKKNIDKFRALVEELTATARSKPMQGVYSVQHSLATTQHSRLIDHPDRLHLPWKTVQDMAIILPGTITTIYSSESGQGKSTFAIQATLFAARESGKVALNYQAEMSPLQIDTIFTSHLLKKDRLQLQNEDYQKAAQILGPDFKYYIGRDTSLTNIGEVLDLIEAAIKRFGAEIVILDNLHFLARNEIDSVKATANAMQRITNLTAKYGLYFFVVHQARKADQNHKRKVTHVSDLDGSKAVQNDSTTIFSIHREEVKHGKDETDSDSHEYSPVTEIRLQKARDKGEGTSFTRVMFLGNICTFADMSGVSPAQEESETTEGEGLF